MKRIIIVTFCVLCLFQHFPVYAGSAADTKSATISIPISTGLIGNVYSSKQFSLELPSGVSASSVIKNTLKYNGINEVSSLQLISGKILAKLNGVANQKTVEVQGLLNGQDPFTTSIGNNIWRYSDGRTWQINDYNPHTDKQYNYDLSAMDSSLPSQKVNKVTVNAAANLITVGRSWKTKSMEHIPDEYVQVNTIKFVPGDTDNWVTKMYSENGKVITSYTIPILPGDPTYSYLDVTKEASIPITGYVQGRFYVATVSYTYSATAKVPTYSYAGTVTFDYKLPTEPTLTGEVGLIDPNPNPARASGSDIPVKISIKGLLSAYQISSNIEEWVFFAKETGNEASLKTKKDQAKVFTSQQSFDFLISKTKTNVPNFTQNYTLTVTVRFAQPVITAGGSVSSLSETFTINASTYTGPGPSTTPPPTSGPGELYPPFARITAPTKVKGGQSFIVSGANSFDKDGTIVSYAWEQPNANEALYGKSSDTSYPLSLIGTTQTITLKVTDNSGLTGTTSQDVEVVAPVPAPYLTVGGTLKENRKVSLHNETRVRPEDFPIVPAKTKFKIEWLEGNGSNADIKYNGSLNGIDDVDFLVKSPGKYRVSLYVENTAGYGATATKTLTISPDEAPIPYISIPSGAYRDPSDGNRARVVLDDLSISPDFDYLAHRFWQYRYDSDNDGNFNEENWVVISDANLDRVTFYLTEVGRYEFRLTLTEEFGQPTIDNFVTVADRRTANTDSQATTEKIITVYNRKPVTDWTW